MLLDSLEGREGVYNRQYMFDSCWVAGTRGGDGVRSFRVCCSVEGECQVGTG